MRRVGVAVVMAVLSAAGAGLALGLAFCQQVTPAADGLDLHAGDRSLVEKYVANFELDGTQTILLRAILRRMRDEETDIYRRNRANLPPDVQEDLTAPRRGADTRIQFMLDAKQRVRYEQEQNRATENDKR